MLSLAVCGAYRSLDLRAFQTRYVMKYRHCDGKLVLKVTDDKVVRCVDSLELVLMSVSFELEG